MLAKMAPPATPNPRSKAMNPTLDYLLTRRRAKLAASARAVHQRAAADARTAAQITAFQRV